MAALAAAAMPTVAQQVNYDVSGTFADNGKKVYLIDQLKGQPVDSMTVSGGRFAFSGKADRDAFMAVQVEGRTWMTPFFVDGTPVIVNINDSTLKGSPLNERLTKYDLDQNAPMQALSREFVALSPEQQAARADEFTDRMNKVLEDQAADVNRIFEQERQTLIPVAFAELYFYDNGPEAYDDLVKLQLPMASHPYLKKKRDDVAQLLQPQNTPQAAFVGQQFTDLEMADAEGKMHKISELVGQGKWVLVDFWASWCGPCRAEMPNVLEAYNKYHAKGLEVVGISFDQNREAWLKAVAQLKLPWLQLSDLKGWKCAAAPVYKIEGIPDNILIDPQGKIIGRALRGKPMQRRLAKIFGE